VERKLDEFYLFIISNKIILDRVHFFLLLFCLFAINVCDDNFHCLITKDQRARMRVVFYCSLDLPFFFFFF